MSSYSADSIQVLTDSEVTERFDWAKIGQLAAQYHKSPEWVEKGLAACREAGVPDSYFVKRYLEKDPTVPHHEGVEEAYRHLFVRKA